MTVIFCTMFIFHIIKYTRVSTIHSGMLVDIKQDFCGSEFSAVQKYNHFWDLIRFEWLLFEMTLLISQLLQKQKKINKN